MKPPRIETTVFIIAFCISLMPLLTGADAMRGAAAEFRRTDADGDGRVTHAEHDTRARGLFEEADGDRDGWVTAREIDAVVARTRAGERDEPSLPAVAMVRMLDGERGAALTAAQHAAGARAVFTAMDADHDGALTPPELIDGYARLALDHAERVP